jgi:hypothetical protein
MDRSDLELVLAVRTHGSLAGAARSSMWPLVDWAAGSLRPGWGSGCSGPPARQSTAEARRCERALKFCRDLRLKPGCKAKPSQGCTAARYFQRRGRASLAAFRTLPATDFSCTE